MKSGMSQVDLGFVAGGATLVVLAVIAVVWMRWRRRDREFVGITPGLLPATGQAAAQRRVRGGQEWKGTVPVQFHPPRGVSPAAAGVVLDGKADPHDLGALLVDLSVRGYFHIRRAGDDWEFHLAPPPQHDRPAPLELELVRAIFRDGPTQRLSTLKGSLGITLQEAQVALYREVVERGWYDKHPRSRNAVLGCLGMLALIGAGAAGMSLFAWSQQHHSQWWWTLPAGGGLGGLILALWGRGRTPRTAAGTAARVQVLGFRKYIETAEARQIRFEEAAGIFARYLPYAMVFGLAHQWATLIGSVLEQHRLRDLAGDTVSAAIDPFAWDALGGLIDLAGVAPDVAGAFAGVPEVSSMDFGVVDGITSSVDGLVSGVGDFVSSAGDLFGGGGHGCSDGCDACSCIDW